MYLSRGDGGHRELRTVCSLAEWSAPACYAGRTPYARGRTPWVLALYGIPGPALPGTGISLQGCASQRSRRPVGYVVAPEATEASGSFACGHAIRASAQHCDFLWGYTMEQ